MSDETRSPVLIPFEIDHLALIDAVPRLLIDPRTRPLLVPGGALTLVGNDGVLGCGGLIALGDDRAEAWVVMSPTLRARPMVLHRVVSRALAASPFARVGASVRRDFAEGGRWLARLGFERAGTLGDDYVRYEKWRNSHC